MNTSLVMPDEFDLDIRVTPTARLDMGKVGNATKAHPDTNSDGYTCITCMSCGCGPTQLQDSHCPCFPPA